MKYSSTIGASITTPINLITKFKSNSGNLKYKILNFLSINEVIFPLISLSGLVTTTIKNDDTANSKIVLILGNDNDHLRGILLFLLTKIIRGKVAIGEANEKTKVVYCSDKIIPNNCGINEKIVKYIANDKKKSNISTMLLLRSG